MVRRILVTGANSGVGLALVRRCLMDHDDAHVVMACRNTARGQAALDGLVAESPSWRERLLLLELDTASDGSVLAAAARLAGAVGADPPPLYAIVNNAGISGGLSSDIREVVNVNVRGVRRVDQAFLPLLDPAGGRIVQMSSGAGPGFVRGCSEERKAFFTDASVTWEQIEGLLAEVEGYPNGSKDFPEHGFPGSSGGYSFTKAVLNLYTMVLAREHPALKINALSPGFVATDIIGNSLPWWVPVPNCALRSLAVNLAGAKAADESPPPVMHLLFSPDLQGNGRYYGSDAKRSPLDAPRNPGSPEYEGP